MSLRAAIASNGRRLRIPASDVMKPITGPNGNRGLVASTAAGGYIGNLVQPISSLTFLYYVSVQSTGITWAECAVAIGDLNAGGNPDLTVVGYADISGDLTVGAKRKQVTFDRLPAGSKIWLLTSVNATSLGNLASLVATDVLRTGSIVTRAATRPSSSVGVPQTYSIDPSTNPFFLAADVS